MASFLESCDEHECRAVIVPKKLFWRTWFNSNWPSFWGISEAITQLEGRGEITHGIQIYENVLNSLAAPELSKYKTKFENVISKNPDFKSMVNVAKVLRGEHVPELSVWPSEISKFAYAPIVSVEVERTFSYSKRLLSPQRGRYTVEHMKWALVVMWNNDS